MVGMAAPASPLENPQCYREPCRTVERSQVQDPVTGLPLWRYRFRSAHPVPRPNPLPARAWRVLQHHRHDEVCVLESEFARHAQPLAHDPSTLSDQLLDPLFESIGEAQRLGVVHGDLGIHRLWWDGRNLRIEGYGIPWRPGATVAEDAQALAASLLAQPAARWSEGARARLNAIAMSGDPLARSSPLPPETAPLASESVKPPIPPPVASRGTATAEGRAARPPRAKPTVGRRAPGGSRAATLLRAWPLALAASLIIGTLGWLLSGAGSDSQPDVAIEHTLEVTVQPIGQPPASLVVLRSPEGSLFRPGSVLGSVPGKVSLDRHGAWILQGRFLDAFTGAVELVAPFDERITLTFPAAARAANLE
jgi:hypothetical protein